MRVVYVLTTHIPKDGENETMEQIRRRNMWENDDYVCSGLILNGMSDSLFDIYQNVKSFKEQWDSLEAKYMAEDASTSFENRPPMLNKENYVLWSSRLLWYAKSRPNGKIIHNSIINGPYVRRMIHEPGDPNREVPVNETFHVQTNDELTEKELKQIKADNQAIQTILLGLPEDIYDSGFELTGFSDVDYAGCKDTFKSTSGGAQFLGEKLVSWSSKKQDCTTLSIAEEEYVHSHILQPGPTLKNKAHRCLLPFHKGTRGKGHLRIEESLKVQDSDKPRSNNVAGPSVVNMVELNNSSKNIDNRGKCKHHDNTRADPNKKANPNF
uniref:Zinc finger, CCHC-type n=1 Tax=Tanacetum cinerariifolium TaxID=118510 RepID=A0A6L2MHI4_TANCI|nr:zinc finger, CCHC-type [Tanacetum cinerariifolium]